MRTILSVKNHVRFFAKYYGQKEEEEEEEDEKTFPICVYVWDTESGSALPLRVFFLIQ